MSLGQVTLYKSTAACRLGRVPALSLVQVVMRRDWHLSSPCLSQMPSAVKAVGSASTDPVKFYSSPDPPLSVLGAGRPALGQLPSFFYLSRVWPARVSP